MNLGHSVPVRLAPICLLVVAACDPGDRRDDSVPDALEPDAYVCIDQTPYLPVSVSGSAPVGPLTSLRYMYGLSWSCGPYEVALVEGTDCDEGLGPKLMLRVLGDVTAAGEDVPVAVTYGELEATGSFHIVRLDSQKIAGHFVVTDSGWNVDLDVDVPPRYASCTI